MNFPKKVERNLLALKQYRQVCTSDMGELIDVIQPMLYKENHLPIRIDVGKQKNISDKNEGFSMFLSSSVNKFSILLENTNNDICLVIKDTVQLNIVTKFNLNLIKNISIKKREFNSAHLQCVTYKITFSYGDVDYILEFRKMA